MSMSAINEKVLRLAHRILTQEVWPANLTKLDDAFDVVFVLLKALIKSNAKDSGDFAGMVAYVEERFVLHMSELKEEGN